ncbi:MAG: peptidoglycan DD-metalloendopeptidase family protein [Rhodospirillaceae bacterium]|nr:peptidoglycan DD-metalloendopeptidase family protein [Rhodospirillaceae bacterium]
MPIQEGKISRALDRWFPERQLMLRSEGRVSYLVLSKRLQMTAFAAVLAVVGWSAFASVSYVFYGQFLDSKDNQVANARLAYRSLLSQVSAYQRKFSTITGDLESNHSMMLELVEKNASLQQNLKTVSSQLKTTEQERESVLAVRQALRESLATTENELRSLNSRNFALKDNLETVEADLQIALSERNDALFNGTRMRRQIKELDTRLADLETTEQGAVQQLTERTINLNDSMERVVEMAGLDVEKLVRANKSLPKGQGGPFIAATPDGKSASKLKAGLTDLEQHLQQSEGLQDIMRRMPMAPPLTSYRVTSSFGKRRDPINKKWAAHYGLDMGSPFKSPVYVAAPGLVKFAGWNGKFGKMIEIDHGAGLTTRFAHLNKILVKKGQQVNFRDKVGLLGSTGRSTGAHLHYEIIFKGRSMNPLKFFKAGRYVFQE